MKTSNTLVWISGWLLTLSVLASPIYRLKPGQTIDYENLSSTPTPDSQIWVIDSPSPDHWRVVFSQDGVLGEAIISSDGSYVVSPNADVEFTPEAFFPRLPRGRERQWQEVDPRMESTANYQLVDRHPLQFQASYSDPISVTTDETFYRTFTIDPDSGLVGSYEEQVDVAGQKSDLTAKLKSIGIMDEATTKAFKRESAAYFTATDDYTRLTNLAINDPVNAPPLLQQAGDTLTAARQNLTNPLFTVPMDQLIQDNGDNAGLILLITQSDAQMIGKAAPNWTLKDLQGNSHSLTDYQGKVVVLDFWFADCPWCMLSIPRLVDIENQYKAQSVALIGMNVDEDITKAVEVEKELGSNYSSMQANSVYIQYGVETFPTMMILDSKGVVRKMLHGYTPTLREDLQAAINRVKADN